MQALYFNALHCIFGFVCIFHNINLYSFCLNIIILRNVMSLSVIIFLLIIHNESRNISNVTTNST